MKYLANLHWWHKGEFEEAVQDKERMEAARRDNLPCGLPVGRYKVFLFDWEGDRKEALGEAMRIAEVDTTQLCKKFSSMDVSPVPYPTVGDLLKAPVVYQRLDGYDMRRYLPGDLRFGLDSDKIEASGRVRTDYYVSHNIDGNRGMYLAAVFFDDQPVLVFQTAGRGGRDHEESWQISGERFYEMCGFLRTCMEDEHRVDDVPLDKEIPGLCVFYGMSIADLPKRSGGFSDEEI